MVEKSALKHEAESILKSLDLISLLKKYGTTEIVGSVELDLIVKLDIDIHVLLKKKTDLEASIFKIAKDILNLENVHEIRLSDYRVKDSFKISLDQNPSSSGNWTIDIWITKNEKETGFDFTKEIQKNLTPNVRDIILEFKSYYHNKGLLRDGLSKVIYEAVIKEKISTIGDFEAYLTDISFFE